MTTVAKEKTGQSLISEKLFDRLVNRIQLEQDMDHELASRITDQALAFLGTCAVSTVPLSPSAQVDIGWHTFLMYTREYREFCTKMAGRFIDHEPQDVEEDRSHARAATVTDRAVTAILEAGFAVDRELWEVRAAKCNDGEKCRASGKDGNENTETNDPEKR
ncbi:glycine-rich domain-containing protein [Amycolatopsis sp. NPDC059021]|uniref:glycine-rich domain-containing protein n=1 Tax=Amycolatopsis sp. NPDC059021 TaxID=3346704 RepID=UPI003670FBFD